MKAQVFRGFLLGRVAVPAALATSLCFGAGCHTVPASVTITTAAIGGTIAGVINGPADTLANRGVTIVNIDTGQRFQTTTGENGGYSLRVPPGTYRLDVELHDGERLADNSKTILLKNSDEGLVGVRDVNVGRQ